MFTRQSVVSLPNAVETWQILGADTALFGQIVAVFVLSIVCIVIFFIHRKSMVLYHSQSLSKDKASLTAGIPVLSLLCYTGSAVLPRSCLIFISISRAIRVAESYLLLVQGIKQIGGSVCFFRLSKLKLNHKKTISEYKEQHSTLSTSLLLLTIELFSTLTLHLSLLLLFYDNPLRTTSILETSSSLKIPSAFPVYPSPLLTSPLLMVFYVGQLVACVFGMSGGLIIVAYQAQRVWVPVVVKLVSVLLVVVEMILTQMIEGDQWRKSLVGFLVTNALIAAVVLLAEQVYVIKLQNDSVRDRGTSSNVRYHSVGAEDEDHSRRSRDGPGRDGPRRDVVVERGEGIQIQLSRQQSRELLRALSLDTQGLNEDVGALLSSRTNMKSSMSSVATY